MQQDPYNEIYDNKEFLFYLFLAEPIEAIKWFQHLKLGASSLLDNSDFPIDRVLSDPEQLKSIVECVIETADFNTIQFLRKEALKHARKSNVSIRADKKMQEEIVFLAESAWNIGDIEFLASLFERNSLFEPDTETLVRLSRIAADRGSELAKKKLYELCKDVSLLDQSHIANEADDNDNNLPIKIIVQANGTEYERDYGSFDTDEESVDGYLLYQNVATYKYYFNLDSIESIEKALDSISPDGEVIYENADDTEFVASKGFNSESFASDESNEIPEGSEFYSNGSTEVVSFEIDDYTIFWVFKNGDWVEFFEDPDIYDSLEKYTSGLVFSGASLSSEEETERLDRHENDEMVDPKSKQIQSCSIEGMSFVITGTLSGSSRQAVEEMILKNGGKILSGVSSKLNFLVVGEKPGSKLDKARKIESIKIIDEQTLMSMIKTLSPMVLVPGGTFTMGGDMDSNNIEEFPTHSVMLNSFYMGKYEVTQAEYAQYMQPERDWDSNYGLGDNYPSYYVSWYAILKYCNLRSMAEELTPVYSISGSTNPADWGSVPTSQQRYVGRGNLQLECQWLPFTHRSGVGICR
ncbi:MAG: SUMF1/EgtB/PvdO family nonheme iron enzyme [Methanolobus sp.]|uniref:formylglycine-generating enzyme family protein n=1 Tax=Methanolobus sp. TaxID=1874737 RepID=UPI00272F4325|nr:SUMF1/EgtB/PvdO family nonheme iron enzyme [Methanolobus sp.]MDP2216972.1 SUMF1/EgtB/PvdO family nonheme iron enzyme [Methanolobus sp.]